MNRPFRWLLVGCIAWGCLFAARRADCSEPVRRFFDGLRQRGYFEEALEYLDQLRQGDCADASFREVIDYEAGLTLIDMAHAGQPDAASEKLLDQAEGRLARFLAEHPWHVLAAAAKTQLAGVLVERGRLKAEQARSSDPAGRQQAIESVRALYRQARDRLAGLAAAVRGGAGQAAAVHRSQGYPAARASATRCGATCSRPG